MNLEVITDPKLMELSLRVMEMESDIDEDYLVPFTPDEEDDDGNLIVKTRKGDYGKEISYIPVKHIRKRLDSAFKQKWSFFILGERKETEPFQKYSKNDNDYVDGDNYLRCVGVMIVPGLGIRMEYGVKKVFGASEATDWKACKTDAFKKCAEAFGIYLDYSDEDIEDDYSNDNSKKKSKRQIKKDLEELEYTEEDLEDALETEVTFGKYNGSTLQEIVDDEDDLQYIEWLAENARDDDMQFMASVVLKYYEEQEAEKSKHRQRHLSNNNKQKGRNTKSKTKPRVKSKVEYDYDEEDEEQPIRKKSSKRTTGTKYEESEREKEQRLKAIIEERYLSHLNKAQREASLRYVSTSDKYPNGKSDLRRFTLDELEIALEMFETDED